MKKVSSVCAKAEIDAHRLREYYDVERGGRENPVALAWGS